MKQLAGGRRVTARRLIPSLILMLIAGSVVSTCLADERASQGDAHRSTTSRTQAHAMKIRLTINGRPTTATLDDTPSARDFLTLLPLTLKLDDYNATEKIATLPHKLSTQGAPVAIEPRVGDFAYYAPWGNLALFYRDFGNSTGLIRLGRFDAGVELLEGPGSLDVTIEAAPR